MALLHRDHDHASDVEVPDHPPAEWSTSPPQPTVVRRNSKGQTVRTVLATACVLALAAFMVLNTADTEVDLGFDTFTSPLWATTGIAAAVGLLLGVAVGRRRD